MKRSEADREGAGQSPAPHPEREASHEASRRRGLLRMWQGHVKHGRYVGEKPRRRKAGER